MTKDRDDLISRQAAIDAIRAMQTYKLFTGDDLLLVDQAEAQTELMVLPSAQPERKRGRWTLLKNGNAICSECKCEQVSAYDFENWDNFCHHCGADMRGEQE